MVVVVFVVPSYVCGNNTIRIYAIVQFDKE